MADDWKEALARLKQKNKPMVQPIEEDEGIIEEIPEQLPPVEVRVQPVPQQVAKRFNVEKRPQPQQVEEETDITTEEAELLVQKLLQDEDVVLYLKTLQGEAKLKLAQKLQH